MAFSLSDPEGHGTISQREMWALVLGMGQMPTDREKISLLDEINALAKEQLDFTDFLGIMSQLIKDFDTEDEIMSAFQQFDRRGTGEITFQDMQAAFKVLGEKVSDQDLLDMHQATIKAGSSKDDTEI
jgi:Ca2+-binding EF-hand superfamily protein